MAKLPCIFLGIGSALKMNTVVANRIQLLLSSVVPAICCTSCGQRDILPLKVSGIRHFPTLRGRTSSGSCWFYIKLTWSPSRSSELSVAIVAVVGSSEAKLVTHCHCLEVCTPRTRVQWRLARGDSTQGDGIRRSSHRGAQLRVGTLVESVIARPQDRPRGQT